MLSITWPELPPGTENFRVDLKFTDVNEYWVVDLDSRTFERSTPDDDRVEVLGDTLQWLPAGASEALTIDITQYFTELLDN